MMPGDGDGLMVFGWQEQSFGSWEYRFFLVELIKKTLKSFVL